MHLEYHQRLTWAGYFYKGSALCSSCRPKHSLEADKSSFCESTVSRDLPCLCRGSWQTPKLPQIHLLAPVQASDGFCGQARGGRWSVLKQWRLSRIKGVFFFLEFRLLVTFNFYQCPSNYIIRNKSEMLANECSTAWWAATWGHQRGELWGNSIPGSYRMDSSLRGVQEGLDTVCAQYIWMNHWFHTDK